MNDLQNAIYLNRFRAYEHLIPEAKRAEMNGLFKDEFDEMPGSVYFTTGSTSSVRLNVLPPFMATKYFNWTPEPDHVEVSRLALDPLVRDPAARLKMLQRLMAQVVRRAWGKVLLAEATEDLAQVYSFLLGFERVPDMEPVEVYPGIVLVMLRLDLREREVQSRVVAALGEMARP